MTTPPTEQQAVHDPILHPVTVAFIGRRWKIACPCGRVPERMLTPDEVNDEMRRHPVGGAL